MWFFYPCRISKFVGTRSPRDLNYMMTSSNGNTFRVTGPLCGEFTGHRWIPRTKASDAERWFFFFLSAPWINGWVNNCEAGDLKRYHAHYNVIVMKANDTTMFWAEFDNATERRIDVVVRSQIHYLHYLKKRIRPFGPSDAMWWHRTESTLVQVMPCFLMTPNHHLNQCWPFVIEVNVE